MDTAPDLTRMLGHDGCRGVVRSRDGELRVFRRRGVADLVELCDSQPDFFRGGEAADKVVGRGAALLFVRGGLARLHALVASKEALDVLRRGGVSVRCDCEVNHIANRTGTGTCPVELLTHDIDDPDEAFEAIKKFVEHQKTKQ